MVKLQPKSRKPKKIHSNNVFKILYDETRNCLYTSTWDPTVCGFDIRTWKSIFSHKCDSWNFALCHHENTLIVSTNSGELIWLDVRKAGECVKRKSHFSRCCWFLEKFECASSYGVDEIPIVSATGHQVKVFSMKSGEVLTTFNSQARIRSGSRGKGWEVDPSKQNYDVKGVYGVTVLQDDSVEAIGGQALIDLEERIDFLILTMGGNEDMGSSRYVINIELLCTKTIACLKILLLTT